MKKFQLSAIAVALMGVFSTANADAVDIPAIPEDPTIKVDTAPVYGKVSLKEGETGVIYAPAGIEGGNTPTLIYAENGSTMTNDGTVWVVGGPDRGKYAEGMGGVYSESELNTVINRGTIYVLANGDTETTIKAMGSNPNVKAVNQGEIVVDGGYGLVVNSGSGLHEAINDEAGTIHVMNGGYGMYFAKELGSDSEVNISNAGEIYAEGEGSHGVFLGGENNNFTFHNSGLIESTNGADAIHVASGAFTISLEESSSINGKVVASPLSSTTIKAVNNEDAFTLDAAKLAALELTNSSLTLEGDQENGTAIGTLSVDKDSALSINGDRDILVQTSLTNTGSISANHLSVDGGTFNNQGVINVQTLDLYGSATDQSEIAGQINASEKITYRGIGGNMLGRSLTATLNTPLLHIIGEKHQTGFLISDSDVLANVQKVQIESQGARTGLTFQGDITVDSEIEFSGVADSRIEINEGSDVTLTKLTSSSADGKLQINKGAQVAVDSLQVTEGTKLNLEVNGDKSGAAVFNFNEITVDKGASFNASVWSDSHPDITIAGDLNINLGEDAVVDFGARKNSDWIDTKIHIDSEKINVNVADSDKHGTVYLSKAGTDLDKTTVTVNADGSNNTGNATEDLSKLTDVVLLTSKDDYTANQGDVTQKESVDGAQLSVDANDIYDASQATLVVNENGESTLANVQTTANANIHGISEMAALGLHIWRNEINDMNKRLGELRDSSAQSNGVWARVYNGRAEFGGQNITNKYTAFQFGLDRQISDGVWVGGAVSYTNGDNDFSYGGGDSSLLAFTAYGSWLADNGLFLDVTGKVGRMKNTFDITMPSFTSSGDYHTNAVSVSAEAGWRFYPTEMFYVEPQVEFMYGHVDSVEYSTSTGVNVSQKAADAMIGRAGFVLGMECPQDRGNAYIRASVLHDWDGEADFAFSKDNGAMRSLTEDLGGTWYEYGIGFNLNATEKTHIYADLEASDGGEVDTDYRINVGVRYAW